jgi:alcohol dehydrogenase
LNLISVPYRSVQRELSDILFSQANRDRLTKLSQWVDQNNVKVNIDKTFSLDEAAKALDYQKDAHPRGKIVLTV